MKTFNWSAVARWMLILGLMTSAPSLSARTVTVGVHHNPPKIFIDEQGTPSGILGELIKQIAREQGWDLRTVSCQWQDCLDALDNARIDLLPDVAHTPERAERFGFHQTPGHHSWSQLFTRPDIDVNSMLDLENRRIAVLEGSVQQDYLVSALESFGIKAQLLLFSNFDNALDALEQNQADVIATNHHYGTLAAQSKNIEPTNVLFEPARLFFAAPKGQNTELLAAIDSHLETWRNETDSFYYANLRRWGGATVIKEIPQALFWGLGGAGFLLLATILMAFIQRRVLQQRTAQIRATEAKFSTILNAIDAGVFIKNHELVYQYANDRLCKMLGMSAQQIIGHTDQELFDKKTAQTLGASDRDLLAEKERFISKEQSLQRPSNDRLMVFTVKMPLLDEHGKPYAIYGVATDLTKEHEVAQRMERLRRFDSLTALPNRTTFLDELNHTITTLKRSQNSVGLILIDLDNFKSLNDTRGHTYGDLLLIQVARRLQAFCEQHGNSMQTFQGLEQNPGIHGKQRHQECQPARLSGDTFAMLVPLDVRTGQAAVGLQSFASDVLSALTEAYQLEDVTYRASASIGATLVHDGFISAQRALRHAELALYEAKAAGSGQTRLFELWMEQAATLRSQLEYDIVQAIEKREFKVFYQVQVDESLITTGVEALVRWQHPIRGLIGPSEFIGFAESNGLILGIGQQVLEIACAQIATWQKGPDTRHLVIAVNVSAKQLYNPTFLDQLTAALANSGANPSRLEIEITESQLIVDMQVAIQTMQAIRAMGVRISLDDFGTGFSSLSHLRQLPLDQLKIDQAFVRDLPTDPNGGAIVQAIIELGNTLKLDVIAEGVETWTQHERLQQMGCKRYQGYLFGRPCSIEELQLGSIPLAPDPDNT